tara:strand:- start:43197 stop:43778 length:582 start_codon:yes stop_codon:yes gene_type:complete
MKKLLYLFIAGALFACSSSTQLSNFSKQKYTKKFHHKTKKYNDVIDEYANEFKSTNKLNEYTISHKTPNTKFSHLYKPVFKEITTKKYVNKTIRVRKSEKINKNLDNSINNELASFEQFSFKNQVKNEILNNKKSSNKSKDVDTLLLIIIAIFIPPLAVALYEGITTNFWIDLLLTLLFFIPGLIYAIIVITG